MKIRDAFSSMVAALGSRGGKVSKRKPGKLQCILMELFAELDSNKNHDAFRYWQVHSIAATADNSADDTCWFKYSLHAKPQKSYGLGARFEKKGPDDNTPVYFPEQWVSCPCDGDYIYHYFDGEEGQTTNAHTIRSTLYRIRCAAKRLSVIDACQDEV